MSIARLSEADLREAGIDPRSIETDYDDHEEYTWDDDAEEAYSDVCPLASC